MIPPPPGDGPPPRAPAPKGHREHAVPLMVGPTYESMEWAFERTPDGQVTCLLTIQWACVTGVFQITKRHGIALADALREGFGGIEVASEMPDGPNGQGPQGPLRSV